MLTQGMRNQVIDAMRLPISLFLVVMLTACVRTTEPEWAPSFDAAAQQFELVRQMQARDIDAALPEAQSTYEHMQASWSRVNDMHSGMMQSMQGHGMMGSHRMGAGMFDPSTMMQFSEMGEQTLSYSLAMQQMMSRSGHREMADSYGQMAERMRGLLSRLPAAPSASTAPQSPNSQPDGARIFASNCASCHGVDGEGITGVFPPLNGSTIASGPKDAPIEIVLRGLQGPLTVAGQPYDGVMPAYAATLSDAEIAAVLSFVRFLPENGADAVTAAQVTASRDLTASRREPFTAAELDID